MTVRKWLCLLGVIGLVSSLAGAAGAYDDSTSSNSAVPLKSTKLQALSVKMAVLQAGTGPLSDAGRSPVLPDDIIDLAEARQLNAHPQSFIAPTTDGTGLCLAGPGRMACTKADDLAQSGASPAVVWNADGQTHLFGFTTDDVDQVSVEFADGTKDVIRATANVLDAQLRDRPVAIRWEGPHGPEVLETAAPPVK